VSMGETNTGDGTAGAQSDLSSSTQCQKGEAYCASTGRCYNPACLSCCMFTSPPSSTGTATDPAPSSTGSADQACAPGACGEPLDSVTYLCSDGSLGGNTGRCLRNADGTCGWEWRECPDGSRP